MIVHDSIEQGTPEWFSIRLGVATAGSFDKLITAGGKPSAQVEPYACELAAEEFLGTIEESGFQNSYWMDRGTAMEAEARIWYEIITDNAVEEVGFCVSEDGNFGCSPDGLTFKRTAGLEIKCPSRAIHTTYLRDGGVPAKYKAQVQGCIMVCEADHWDFLSYHPELPKLIVREDRDDAYIAKLKTALDKLIEIKESATEKLMTGDFIYGQ